MFTESQQFFVNRLSELLNRKTIDSYRVRVLNPYTALKEMLVVYEDFIKGSVKNFETLSACVSETRFLLKNDDTIIFETIEKKFFEEEVLKKIQKDNAEELFNTVKISFSTIFRDNTDYVTRIIYLLHQAIDAPLPADPFKQLDRIYNLTGVLASELLSMGFDKGFLSPKCYRIFIGSNPPDFEPAFSEFTEMIRSKGVEYWVWFKIYASKLKSHEWPIFQDWETHNNLSGLMDINNPIIIQFLSEKRGYFFIGTQIKALDHFSALRICKQKMSEMLDMVSLAHHHSKIEVQPHALIYPSNNPIYAGLQLVRHIHDGKFPSGEGVLKKLQEKTPAILNNDTISSETKEKIKSALRYLRFGNEAFEIEHQLINYWIGLEYLFSNDRESTFTRIKTLLPILHELVYIQRNFSEFHHSISQIQESRNLTEFKPENINCLLEVACLEEIRDQFFIINPLLSYRAWKILNRIIRSNSGTKDYLQQHRTHLEWHLARIYRIRNKIVHEAKHSINNQTLASNLRYYLAFSLSMIIDYFSAGDPDAKNMEEFFSLQQLRHKNLDYLSFPIAKMIKQDHHSGLLS